MTGDYRRLLRWVLAASGRSAAECDAYLAAMPRNTLETHLSAWRGYIAHIRADESAWPPTEEKLLRPIKLACEKSFRPAGTVNSLRSTINLLFSLSPPSFGQSPFVNAPFAAFVDALVRNATAEPTRRQPVMDMRRILAYLRREAVLLGPDASHSQLLPIAVAAFAAVTPSRPGELATLVDLRQTTLVLPASTIGRLDLRVPLASTPPRRWKTDSEGATTIADVDQLAAFLRDDIGKRGFFVDITLIRSKGDRKRSGITKRLQHPPNAIWSPAYAVVLLVQALWREHRARLEAAARASRPLPLFGQRGALSDSWAAFSPDWVSNLLGRVAVMAVGERITGRGWRPAAASFLLSCGVDPETVAALGGWSSTESLRKYYVRAVPLSDSVARRIAGESDEAAPIAPLSPLVRAAAARAIGVRDDGMVDSPVARPHVATPRVGTPITPRYVGRHLVVEDARTPASILSASRPVALLASPSSRTPSPASPVLVVDQQLPRYKPAALLASPSSRMPSPAQASPVLVVDQELPRYKPVAATRSGRVVVPVVRFANEQQATPATPRASGVDRISAAPHAPDAASTPPSRATYPPTLPHHVALAGLQRVQLPARDETLDPPARALVENSSTPSSVVSPPSPPARSPPVAITPPTVPSRRASSRSRRVPARLRGEQDQ